MISPGEQEGAAFRAVGPLVSGSPCLPLPGLWQGDTQLFWGFISLKMMPQDSSLPALPGKQHLWRQQAGGGWAVQSLQVPEADKALLAHCPVGPARWGLA